MQHTLERRGATWPAAPVPTRAGYLAPDAPAIPVSLPHPTWATPTREMRARALYDAWRAERRDLVQRALLREMLAHVRHACVRAGHPDPLRGAVQRPLEREIAIATG